MNGYGLQLYGTRRYMHPLLETPEQADAVSVYEAGLYIEADVNQVAYDFAVAGVLPEVTGDLPDESGFTDTNVPGIGGVDLVDGVYVPSAPVPVDDAQTWGPTGYTEVDVSATVGWPYTIELRLPNWTLHGYITGWLSGGVEIELGRPSSFHLLLHGDHTQADAMTSNRRIVIRNARGFVIDMFEIGQVEKQRDGDAIYLKVSGQSQAVLLEREAVTTYSTPYDEAEDEDTGEIVRTRHYQTVRQIVLDLLAFQEENEFTLAEIDATIGDRLVIWSCDGTSILGALTELQGHLPVEKRGHMWVDYERGLHWILGVKGPAIDINVGEHLTGLGLITSYDDVITRLYPQGRELDDGTRVQLPAPGYVERNTALYGVRAIAKTDNRILYTESLTEWANGFLDEYSVPRIEIRVDVIAARLGGLDSRDLVVGRQYRVVDDVQDISEITRVQRISYDLNDPLAMEVDVSNRRTTIGDLIRRLAEQINEEPVQELTRENLRAVLGSTWSDMATRPDEIFNTALAADIFGPDNDNVDSGYAAREDHLHDEYATPGDVAEAVGAVVVPSPGAGVVAVGEANDDGESADFASVDHKHRGIYTATTKAGLPSVGVAAWEFGMVTAGDEQGRLYHRNPENTAWVAWNFLE